MGEDPRGAFYGGYLFPVDYALQLVPALRAGQLGSSFRFRVLREQRDDRPPRSAHNPERLPERTIREAQIFELGPVTFPAYFGTSAEVRSSRPTAPRRAMADAEWLRYLSNGRQ